VVRKIFDAQARRVPALSLRQHSQKITSESLQAHVRECRPNDRDQRVDAGSGRGVELFGRDREDPNRAPRPRREIIDYAAAKAPIAP
jgi:hypothetical protein